MQYCLPKSFFETPGQEGSTFLPSVWMGIQYRFKVQTNMSAVAWRWDCLAPCEASREDWMHPCAQEDSSPVSTTLNHSSCEIILPRLSLVVQLRTDFSGGGGEERESKKQLWEKKGWFYHDLVSWTASLRQCWVPEQVEKKCYTKWTSGRHSPTLGSSKLLGWQISFIFDTLLCHLPGCFSPSCSTLTQFSLPFTSSPVSSHVSLPSLPPCQFLWPIYANPKPWYLQLRMV